MQSRPNIVLFFTDDQRFDTIAALGNNEVHTPNLDFLVRRGTTMTHAHIPGGTSGAVCMPSRAMLHSGRSLFHLQGEGQSIPRQHVLLGEVLQEAGYKTFGTGKWHNSVGPFARSFSDGGEIFFGGMADHWNMPANHFDPTGKYERMAKRVDNPFFSNKVQKSHCDHVSPGVHSSELVCQAAMDFLDRHKGGAPFFMYLSFLAPHDPRTMPEEFLQMYNPETIDLPRNFAPEHPFSYGVKSIRDELLAPYPRTEKEVKRHIAEYYGMITHLDHELGKVLKSLEEKGELDNTIIIVAGDNGLALGQHGLMGKQSLYEHSVRVPLLISGPNIPAGQQRNEYVYLFDIFPTLCELLGLSVPDSVDGISFAPVLLGNGDGVRKQLYLAYCDLVRGIKDDRYKLIEYAQGSVRTQLFDLVDDPWEMNNLATSAEHTEVLQRLRAALKTQRDQWDDCSHPLGKKFWDAYPNGRE